MEFKDTYIFKYCSFEIGELIITSGLLKLNNPAFFNDPFDCSIDLLKFDTSEISPEIARDIEESRKIAIDNIKGGYKIKDSVLNKMADKILNPTYIENNYKEIQIDKIKKSSICCFSLNYDNMTMWSHYADKHNGVCLIFDINETEIFENKEYNNRINMSIVKYKNLCPENYLKSKKVAIDNLFFTKSKDWKYEEEFRIFILENIKYLKFNPKFFKGVIFGVNVLDENIQLFKNSFKNLEYDEISFAKFRKVGLSMKLEDI